VEGISSEVAMPVETQLDSDIRPNELITTRLTRPSRRWAYPALESAELQAPSPSMPWPAQAVFWAGILAIVAGGFWLQVQINALGRNAAETLLVVISVVLEFGLVWLWNRKFPVFWTRIIVGPLKRLFR
jgi:hypothetical protein